MGDDTTSKKLLGTSSTKADDEELRQLMVGLLKKMETLDTVGERLTRLEAGQQEILRVRTPGMLNLCKDGPMGQTRFHNIDFPTYDGGGNPLPFLNRCEHYFRGQRTIEEEKVWLAVMHLQGTAQQWYMRLEQDEGTPGWHHFIELLDRRFGPPIRSNPLGELVACHRTCTVEDYQERFLALLMRAGLLTESQKVQLFTAGLQEPLSIDVQLQGPASLELAMSFARSYEQRELLTTTASSTSQVRQTARRRPAAFP
jgi:hypothetical protein